MNYEYEINTNMIIWAINRAGLEIYELEHKFPKINQWINESKKPTLTQLKNLAKSIHVPFGYFFLDEPPIEKLEFPYFRTGKGSTNSVSLNVYDTIMLIQKRQDWLSEYLKNEGFDKLQFIGKSDISTPVKDIVSDIRESLGLKKDWAKKFETWRDALAELTNKIDNLGIITIFNGVVGNNTHRKIEVEECRGFVLVDDYAPFMFINNADAKAAQMFSLIHELAHIWLGKSAGFDLRNIEPANDPIELHCDKIAAEFLVPEELFEHKWEYLKNFYDLAKFFKVSQLVIARRALDLKKITKQEFISFYIQYIKDVTKITESKKSGGNSKYLFKKRLNLIFATHINNAVKQNKLLYRDAFRLTNFKSGNTYDKFIREFHI